MKSLIKKWLNEPQLLSHYFQYDVAASPFLFKLNSVDFGAFPNLGSCFIAVIILTFVCRTINKLRLEEIAIKTKKLEYLERQHEVLSKISRPKVVSIGMKKRSRKASCSSDAPRSLSSTELEEFLQ